MTAANTALQLEVNNPSSQRRSTIAFRGLLAIPQWIAQYVIGLIAGVGVIVGWFTAVVTGEIPAWVHAFVSDYVAYQARVSAYILLLTDEYPPFSFDATNYPVQLDMPEQGQLNRGEVLVRLLFAIPAVIVTLALTSGWNVCAFFVWLITLIKGRMPQAAFEAASAMLRVFARYNAWINLLTDEYPANGVFGEKDRQTTERRADTRPLVLSRGGKRLLTTFVLIGLIAYPAYEIMNQLYIQPMIQHAIFQHITHR